MKRITYIGHMTEVLVPYGAASFVFENGKPKEVPDGLHADLLIQPDKFEDAGDTPAADQVPTPTPAPEAPTAPTE